MHFIDRYHHDLKNLIRTGGTKNEQSIRAAFHSLIKNCIIQNGLHVELIEEQPLDIDKRLRPDATIINKDPNCIIGYIEDKDEQDDMNMVISKTMSKYPTENLLMQNTLELVIMRDGKIKHHVSMHPDASKNKLEEAIVDFVTYKPEFLVRYKNAVEQFGSSIPDISTSLYHILEEAKESEKFKKACEQFVQSARLALDPYLSIDDAIELLIQHILTSRIFSGILGNETLLEDNTIAKDMRRLWETVASEKRREIENEVNAHSQSIMNGISSMDEGTRQNLLKQVYQVFYQAYNPQKADRQGIVYTPHAVVKFIVNMTDQLLHQYFHSNLGDKDTEILDPCTGTGVFITEIMRHMSKKDLQEKYTTGLHANEMDILPYYIANLNIEDTYHRITEEYKPYPLLCYVDSIDNLLSKNHKNTHSDISLFIERATEFNQENAARIVDQASHTIRLFISNPPYYANQASENSNNRNKAYVHIDSRIKDSYVKASAAQKTKQYDMYKRFMRWSSDCMGDTGMVAFITNNSYLDAKQDDGFRKCIAEEFDFVYLVNLRGNARKQEAIEGESVFNIQVGTGIMFLIRTGKKAAGTLARIYYTALCPYGKREEKLNALNRIGANPQALQEIVWEEIHPNDKHQWIERSESDFHKHPALIDKNVKKGV